MRKNQCSAYSTGGGGGLSRSFELQEHSKLSDSLIQLSPFFFYLGKLKDLGYTKGDSLNN